MLSVGLVGRGLPGVSVGRRRTSPSGVVGVVAFLRKKLTNQFFCASLPHSARSRGRGA